MAIYYVRTDGNDLNNGLSPSSSGAWQSITKAISGTGVTGGDTVYIAPGDYRYLGGTIKFAGYYPTTMNIIGNPTGSMFSGISAGRVLISNRGTSDITSSYGAGVLISTDSRSNIYMKNLIFESAEVNGKIFDAAASSNLTWDSCLFWNSGYQSSWAISSSAGNGVSRNFLFTKCIALGNNSFVDSTTGAATGPNFDYNITLDRCVNLYVNVNAGNNTSAGRGFFMVNCTGCAFSLYGSKGNIVCKNSNYSYSQYGGSIFILTQGTYTASTGNSVENCIYESVNSFSAVTYNNYVAPAMLNSWGQERLWGISPYYERAGVSGYVINAGVTTGNTIIPVLAGQPGYSSTGVPLTDIYGNPWSGNGTPHIGAYNDYSLTSTGQYNPIERVNDSLTFTPNETSKSINIYLGATGLGYSTSNLVAHYTRQSGTATTISLVNQTPTGSWISGGFAEISSVNQPGLYRLDVPNAAFASGVQFVTVSVRGAATTNGAYVRCQALDIPGTLLNTQAGIYTALGTIGARMLLTTEDNRALNVTSSNQTVFNPADLLNVQAGIYTSAGTLGARLLQTVSDNRPVIVTSANQIQVDAGQTFSSGSGTTILDPILNSVGRWTLEGNTLTLYNADGTYLRRCNLSQLGLSLSPT